MKKLLLGLFVLVGLVVVTAGIGLAVVYQKTNAMMAERIDVTPAAIEIPNDVTSVENGAHIFVTRGCAECHGEDGGGRLIIPGGPMGKLGGTNLTAKNDGALARYDSSADWVRAIRHGLAPDGRKLLFMPSHEFQTYSDGDIGDLIAYMQTLPPADAGVVNEVGPLARVLHLAGQFHLLPADLIDHPKVHGTDPVTGPTAEYGAYLGAMCIGCHGAGYSGGVIPGAPPEWPPARNLTMHDTGLKSWTYEDFVVAMRDGKRPDGAPISEIMPWKAMSHMHDWELGALWAYLQTLEPKAYGGR